MGKKKRMANIELLRIVAMLLIMVLHYLNLTHALPGGEVRLALTPTAAAAVVLESFSISALNVFVIISGYFLSTAAFSYKRLLKIIGQVLFYTLLIPPVLVLAGQLDLAELTGDGLYGLWPALFPIQSGQYWFMTAYVVMCLFLPLINIAVERLEKKQLGVTILGLLLYFSVGKTISPLQFGTDKFGYDYGWLLCLYLVGAWLRRYGIPFFDRAKKGAAVYAGAALLTAAMEILLLALHEKTGALGYYATVPFHFNFLPCLIGAVGLFYWFYHLRIPEGKAADAIRFFSPAALGVYLIHEQMQVRLLWTDWMNELTGCFGIVRPVADAGVLAGQGAVMPMLPYLIAMAVQLPLAFLICLMIDKLRGLAAAKIADMFCRGRKQKKARNAV